MNVLRVVGIRTTISSAPTAEAITEVRVMEMLTLDEAVEALRKVARQMPSAEPERCKDCKHYKYEEVSLEQAAYEISPHCPPIKLWWFDILKELEEWGFVLCRKENQ